MLIMKIGSGIALAVLLSGAALAGPVVQVVSRTSSASAHPMAEAGQVGFRSEAAFRTFFTRRIGVTPSHYATMNGR